MPAVIGVDAGGTKTVAALATADGRVLARASTGPANYQMVGRSEAGQRLREVIESVRGDHEIAAVALALAGLDRPRDESVLRAVVAELSVGPFEIVNDAYAVLRAGSQTGVGIAVVSGTGCNVVGIGADGKRDRVGGLCWELGDFGSATDIGVSGLRAAFRGADGRGPATSLGERIVAELGLARLDDMVDRLAADSEAPFETGELAPVVFAAAEDGDGEARSILRRAGSDLGASVALLARRLFEPGQSYDLVLGGAVLQHGSCDVMRDALVEGAPGARPTVLRVEPVVGAVLLALDHVSRAGGEYDQAAWATLTSVSP